MAKDKYIQIRVGETLKLRYLQALKDTAPDPNHVQSATDHLTEYIIQFVQTTEAKKNENTAPTS